MILYQVAYLIDQLDGPVARYRKQTNLGGEYLDEHTKYLHRAALLAFMSIGAFNRFQNVIYLWLGFICVVFVLMDQVMKLQPFHVYALNTKNEMIKKVSEKSILRQKNRLMEYLIEFFRPQAFNAMLFASIFNVLHYLLIFYAIVIPIGYLNTIIKGYKETARLKN
jgi:phosphatidylglycerophosphate synthase